MSTHDYMILSLLSVLTYALLILTSVKNLLFKQNKKETIAAILIVLPFLCMAIFAFVNSLKCRKANKCNDTTEAAKYSKKALWFNLFNLYVLLIALSIGLILSLFYITSLV